MADNNHLQTMSELNVISITSGFSVSVQVFPHHLERLRAEGYQRILCVRPDHEEDVDEQPPRFQLEAACSARGIKFSHIPIESGAHFPEMALRAGAHLFSGAQEKTLAFCLSGVRSLRLWALSNALAGTIPPDEILHLTHAAGFDMGPFSSHLNRLAAQQDPIYVSDDFAIMI